MIDLIKSILNDPDNSGRDIIALITIILDKVFAYIKGEQGWE